MSFTNFTILSPIRRPGARSGRGGLPNESLFSSEADYQATVKEITAQDIWVVYQGGLWRARPDGASFTAAVNQIVRVHKRIGNVLLVSPVGVN
jgi:membrane protein implicated in regulation of membrane protease activity